MIAGSELKTWSRYLDQIERNTGVRIKFEL